MGPPSGRRPSRSVRIRTEPPDEPFVELGELTVEAEDSDGVSDDRLFSVLRDEAAARGRDAVLIRSQTAEPRERRVRADCLRSSK